MGFNLRRALGVEKRGPTPFAVLKLVDDPEWVDAYENGDIDTAVLDPDVLDHVERILNERDRDRV